MANWESGAIVVELAATKKTRPTTAGKKEPYGPTNTYFHLRTFAERFRGRWRVSQMLGSNGVEGYANMPDIPGIHIIVNVKKQTIRAVDPLQWPDYQDTLEQANDIMRAHFGEGRAWPDRLIDGATPTELKSCLYELREFVDDKGAVVHTDNLPPRKEILAMEGNLNRRIYMQVADRDNVVKPVHLTEGELKRLGQPQESRVKIVPVKAGA